MVYVQTKWRGKDVSVIQKLRDIKDHLELIVKKSAMAESTEELVCCMIIH